jgi:hypothetical protein
MKEMDLSFVMDNYIQESIENALGLPVSADTLQSKLFAMEESRRVLQCQVFELQDLVNDQNKKIEQAKVSDLLLFHYFIFPFFVSVIRFFNNSFGLFSCLYMPRFSPVNDCLFFFERFIYVTYLCSKIMVCFVLFDFFFF